jgi:glc operon protein GlcG
MSEKDRMMEMNLKLAKTILSTAISKAREMGKACSFAIVDEKGWLVALHRMDNAPIPTAEIARDKAWTAATFKIPSSEVSQFGNSRVPGYGLNVQNWNERTTPIPGGLPIWIKGALIGALGICSQTPKEDVFLCQNILKDVFGEKRESDPEKRRSRKKYGRR